MPVKDDAWTTNNNAEVDAELDARGAPDGGGDTDAVFMRLLKSASTHARRHHETDLHPRWSDNYRAWRNQHYSGSKYTSERWRGRSRLFRPKTRTTVRKRLSDAASSLFATNDALNVDPANRANPRQRAAAALFKEILNYRLHRRSADSAIPWFVTAMAAYQDTQMAGICVSKQYWEYEEVQTGTKLEPELDMLGMPAIDLETGMPMMTEVPVTEIRKNRPMIRVFPPENVWRDPSANWIEQAQDSGYLILKHPMQMGDVLSMLSRPVAGAGVQWRDIDEASLKTATGSRGSISERTVREARDDSSTESSEGRSGLADEFTIVWLWENFIRHEGETWHFWSVEDRLVVSDPVPVEIAYPEHKGQRPVVVGFGTIDAHRVDPMSPVESWQSLQMEVNDLVNLRLDALKQSISPVTKVVRGQKISAREIQNRSADGIIYVGHKDDVSWDQIPGPHPSAYQEMERLNADFDDNAGIMSQGSVMTSRTLNETVGGMNMMNQAANSMGQFDVQVWVETWAEPVLRQLVNLERYYETDQFVMTIAGDQAAIEEKYGVAVDFDLLDEPVSVQLNAGIGVSDPMQRLQKLAMAGNALIQFSPTAMQRIKQDEIIGEVMGLAGYQDGARFFHPGDDQDPRITELKTALGQMKAIAEDKQADRDAKLAAEQLRTEAELEEQRMRGDTAVTVKRMDIAGKLISDKLKPPPAPPMANGKSRFPPAA